MTEYRIKVFGERNTGTRAALSMLRAVPNVVIGGGTALDAEMRQTNEALRDAIAQQFRPPWRTLYLDAIVDMESLARGQLGAWKHSMPIYDAEFATSETKVLFMVRDPYSWALSLFRKPYHRKGPRAETLEGFLQQPWMTERRDFLPSVLKSPMVLWNEKLRGIRAFCDEAQQADVATHILCFEDFVVAPVTSIRAALDHFDVPALNVKAIENSTKNEDQQLPSLQKHYRKEHWRRHISRDAAALVEELVDWDLAQGFGYQKRSLMSFPQCAEPIQGLEPSSGRGFDPSESRLAKLVRARMQRVSRSFENLRVGQVRR